MDYTNKSIADQSRNKTALLGATIMNAIIAFAYFFEVLKGTRGMGAYLIIVALCFVPIIAAYVTYLKKKDSYSIRYILSVGFVFLYCYVMYRTTTNTAAQAVMTQQERTAQIDEYVQQVGKGTETVYNSAVNSKENLKKGQEIMSTLLGHVENAEKVNHLVATEMTELHKKSEQMGSIVELINDVASQTELLALNASIEAARAGEAGKGFAVVASEITSLAGQTEDATGKIVNLISDIRESLERVNHSVKEMLENNHTQGNLVEENAKSFEAIFGNTEEILEEITQLQNTVVMVEEANKSVVENISNVSAVTEEITAEANATLDNCEANLRSVEAVGSIMKQLNQNAEELKQK